MEPVLHDGDIVYFKQIPFKKIQVDDICVIKKHSFYITHRVIFTSEKYIITKGEHNILSDGKIYPKQIIGKVYQIKRSRHTFPVESLSIMQNSAYLQEMGRIANLFKKNNIEFVFLKGLPIFLFYTRQKPRRLYADCDILVSEHDFNTAKALLLHSGYMQYEHSGYFSRLLHSRQMEEDFYADRAMCRIALDVHARPFSYIRKVDFPDSLYPRTLMDMFTRELLRTRRWVSVHTAKMPIPDRNYLLLFLSIHFFTHTMKMVHRLWLIKEIIRKDKKTKKSWVSFFALCNRYKAGFMVYPAFYFINKLYKRPIPQFVISTLKPKNSNTDRVYQLKTSAVFDERISISRILNKVTISWVFSPQPLYKRLFLFFSPSMFLLTLTYMVPIQLLLTAGMQKTYQKVIRSLSRVK